MLVSAWLWPLKVTCDRAIVQSIVGSIALWAVVFFGADMGVWSGMAWAAGVGVIFAMGAPFLMGWTNTGVQGPLGASLGILGCGLLGYCGRIGGASFACSVGSFCLVVDGSATTVGGSMVGGLRGGTRMVCHAGHAIGDRARHV